MTVARARSFRVRLSTYFCAWLWLYAVRAQSVPQEWLLHMAVASATRSLRLHDDSHSHCVSSTLNISLAAGPTMTRMDNGGFRAYPRFASGERCKLLYVYAQMLSVLRKMLERCCSVAGGHRWMAALSCVRSYITMYSLKHVSKVTLTDLWLTRFGLVDPLL